MAMLSRHTERSEVEELFKIFDTDGNGQLDMREVEQLLRKGRHASTLVTPAHTGHKTDSDSSGGSTPECAFKHLKDSSGSSRKGGMRLKFPSSPSPPQRMNWFSPASSTASAP